MEKDSTCLICTSNQRVLTSTQSQSQFSLTTSINSGTQRGGK